MAMDSFLAGSPPQKSASRDAGEGRVRVDHGNEAGQIVLFHYQELLYPGLKIGNFLVNPAGILSPDQIVLVEVL